mmetsp:Transcript_31289/g.78413  ORF Transcript_31289/g.78413 Transcript_31289/m.78413 type:complete len:230 (-) Transcript_31289:273-962(-)
MRRTSSGLVRNRARRRVGGGAPHCSASVRTTTHEEGEGLHRARDAPPSLWRRLAHAPQGAALHVHRGDGRAPDGGGARDAAATAPVHRPRVYLRPAAARTAGARGVGVARGGPVVGGAAVAVLRVRSVSPQHHHAQLPGHSRGGGDGGCVAASEGSADALRGGTQLSRQRQHGGVARLLAWDQRGVCEGDVAALPGQVPRALKDEVTWRRTRQGTANRACVRGMAWGPG